MAARPPLKKNEWPPKPPKKEYPPRPPFKKKEYPPRPPFKKKYPPKPPWEGEPPIRKHGTPVGYIPPKKVEKVDRATLMRLKKEDAAKLMRLKKEAAATIMRLKPPIRKRVEPRIGIPPQVKPIKLKPAPGRSPKLKWNIKKR